MPDGLVTAPGVDRFGMSARRPVIVMTPTIAVTNAGTMSNGAEAGRNHAASPARAARPTTRMLARLGLVRDTSPITAAARTTTRVTLPNRIGLSALPKFWTAHSLTGVGVASMTVEPTASTGEAAGLTKAATR